MKKKTTKSAASKKNQKIDWTRHCKNPSDKIKKQLDIIMSKGLPVNDYFSLLNGGNQQLYKYSNGIPVAVSDNDPDVTLKKRIKKEIKKLTEEIKADIEKNGYVKNTKLHRRFVMAHFFNMMNQRGGFHEALTRLGYDYSWEMAIEEFRVLSILERNDTECFNERARFFTKQVATAMLNHDADNMTTAANATSSTSVCVGKSWINKENLKQKAKKAREFTDKIDRFDNFGDIYLLLKNYNDTIRVKKSNFLQCPQWREAYEQNGAYYTLKNMLMFHNCQGTSMATHTIEENVAQLRSLDANRMDVGLVETIIRINNFDFNARMREIYNR